MNHPPYHIYDNSIFYNTIQVSYDVLSMCLGISLSCPDTPPHTYNYWMAAVAPESCELGCWLFCLGCGFPSSHQKQVLLKVVRKEQPEKSVSYWKSIIVFPLSLVLDFIISKVVELFSVANVTCWDLVRASHDCSTVFKSSGSQHQTIRKEVAGPQLPPAPVSLLPSMIAILHRSRGPRSPSSALGTTGAARVSPASCARRAPCTPAKILWLSTAAHWEN